MGYAAIALAAGLAAMLFWQMKRASDAVESEKVALKEAGRLQREVDAKAVAIENRDQMIDALTRERDRYEMAVVHTSKQLQKKITDHVDEPEEIALAVRNALASFGVLQETDVSRDHAASGEIEAKL